MTVTPTALMTLMSWIVSYQLKLQPDHHLHVVWALNLVRMDVDVSRKVICVMETRTVRMDLMNRIVVINAKKVRLTFISTLTGHYIEVLTTFYPCFPITGQFQCGSGGRCIKMNQVCDGTPQCQDNSDEAGCRKPSRICSMRCDWDHHCIPEAFICNGIKDCRDGTDEANCGELRFQNCRKPYFLYTDMYSVNVL